MHPVLGTMMPEICEAPHLPVFPFIHHRAPDLMGWDVFITFLQAGILLGELEITFSFAWIKHLKHG